MVMYVHVVKTNCSAPFTSFNFKPLRLDILELMGINGCLKDGNKMAFSKNSWQSCKHL